MRFKTLLPPRIRDFFDPRFVLLFAIGATVVAFAANALYDFAKGLVRLQDFRWRYLFLFGGAGLSLFIGAWALKVEIEETIVLRSGKKRAPPKRALIVLSSSPEIVKKAIEHHLSELGFGWLLMSKETAPWTQEMARLYTNKERKITARQLSNPADWREVADLVHEILSDLPGGLQPKDVVLDFTGLPKPATVGAALAALHMGAPMQWIPQTTTVSADGKKTQTPGEPEEQDIDYHVFPASARPAAQDATGSGRAT
jgi:hypothetical protein